MSKDIRSEQELEPYLNKLEQVGDNLAELEHTAILLDEYTKRLGECHFFRSITSHLMDLSRGEIQEACHCQT